MEQMNGARNGIIALERARTTPHPRFRKVPLRKNGGARPSRFDATRAPTGASRNLRRVVPRRRRRLSGEPASPCPASPRAQSCYRGPMDCEESIQWSRVNRYAIQVPRSEDPAHVLGFITNQLHAERGWTPFEINEGRCIPVAATACCSLDGAIVAGAFPGDVGLRVGRRGRRFNGEGHFWIMWRGLHYDAEHLTGVDCWTKLPFFAERLAQLRDPRAIEAMRQALLGRFGPRIGRRVSQSPSS